MCPHDPRETIGPIGMYHCPECGEMVLAGIGHIDWELLDRATRGDTNNEPLGQQESMD